MNSLAVRVSSIKDGENLKKNSDIRASLLTLPATKIFDDADSFRQRSSKEIIERFKNDFNLASGVDQQLTIVKAMIVKFIKSDEVYVLSNEEISQILSDIYFHSPLKHPIRCTIVKALQKPTAKQELIIQSMFKTITAANEIVFINKKRDLLFYAQINDFIASLIGCFENFPSAVVAIEQCYEKLLSTLDAAIALFLNCLLSTELSPGKRSEIFIYLHNAIRVTISIVQQFSHKISIEQINEIVEKCWNQMMDSPKLKDLPMDTKVNCGILKICYDRLNNNKYDRNLSLFQQIFEQCELYNESSLSCELCYAVAIINTINENDFDDSNFYCTIRAVIHRLTEIGREYTMDSSIVMASTRALVQVTKKFLTILRKKPIMGANASMLGLAALNCLDYVWLNIEHSVDCVRYLVKDLLKNLLKLGHEYNEIFRSIIPISFKIAESQRTNETLVCLLFDYLCQVLSIKYVLTKIANIQKRLIDNLFKDGCWSTCFERLMIADKENDLQNWCNNWIEPLLQIDDKQWINNFDRLKIIRNLFERALKIRPEAAEYILQSSPSLEIYLFVLWTMRRNGRKCYAPENWIPSTDSKICYAKMHPSDEIRILAFRILTECHKTCEKFPKSDLNEILAFFRYNCNCQSPAIRQQINTTMKRALTRIECGFLALSKEQTDEVKICRNNYKQFLIDLIEFCVDWCLFDGANYSRRTIGLTTLYYSIETWKKLYPNDDKIFTERLFKRLQHTICDSYSTNKELANSILRLCFGKYKTIEIDTIYDLKKLHELITSIRPDDSMTAAYFLEYCSFANVHFKRIFDIIIYCENTLDDGLTLAKQSLIQAAGKNPMYGSLLCTRYILLNYDLKKILDENEANEWREYFKRIVPKCRELTDVVGPIVNSSAPEGHLPNDLSDISNYIQVDGDNAPMKITPQVVLVCAWRTVREASLLIGDIALRTPIIPTQNTPLNESVTYNGLISVDLLLSIGTHFQQLLAETKHRGAFEQTFVGFSKLCTRLWRSNEPQLHACPMKWLRKIASIIAGETIELDSTDLDITKLCATRRSAGIPYMVQALVVSELQVCSTNALSFTMNTFLDIAHNGERAESRTHALNIVRLLFKCTELGEACSEYISDGIECSIRGYSASTWPERNSSTLLFSALMTRVFGVQRTKETENLSNKNKMTGLIFFMRYPKLYDFFLTELTRASEAIQRDERPPRLHPLLLLISRLYPSALEGSQSNLKLSNFIPLISICSSSAELVTRQLSAKSIVALVPASSIFYRLMEIFEQIQNQSQNTLHGFLLQIFYLLRNSVKQFDYATIFNFLRIILAIDIEYNSVTAKTYLEIILEIIFNNKSLLLEAEILEKLSILRNLVRKHMNEENTFNQLTLSYVSMTFHIFEIILLGIEAPQAESAAKFENHETLMTELNIFYLLETIFGSKFSIDLKKLDLSRTEFRFAEFLNELHQTNDEIWLKFLNTIKNSFPTTNILKNDDKIHSDLYPFGSIRAYQILGYMEVDNDGQTDKRESADELLKLMIGAVNNIDELAEAKYFYVSKRIHNSLSDSSNPLSTKYLENILENIREMSKPFRATILRQTAVIVLHEFCTFISSKQILWLDNRSLLINIIELLLMLLRDDNVFVRQEASETTSVLIHDVGANNIDKVIPLAAEDQLLDWLQNILKDNWNDWLNLIKLIRESAIDEEPEQMKRTEIEPEIFESNDINIFGETLYITYKCYLKLMQSIDSSNCNVEEKTVLKNIINLEYPELCDF